eukprot:scaffold360285_cov45-Prasinocladus_malaysianus.AAC.1
MSGQSLVLPCIQQQVAWCITRRVAMEQHNVIYAGISFNACGACGCLFSTSIWCQIWHNSQCKQLGHSVAVTPDDLLVPGSHKEYISAAKCSAGPPMRQTDRQAGE